MVECIPGTAQSGIVFQALGRVVCGRRGRTTRRGRRPLVEPVEVSLSEAGPFSARQAACQDRSELENKGFVCNEVGRMAFPGDCSRPFWRTLSESSLEDRPRQRGRIDSMRIEFAEWKEQGACQGPLSGVIRSDQSLVSDYRMSLAGGQTAELQSEQIASSSSGPDSLA